MIKPKVYASTVGTGEELWRRIQQFPSEIKYTPEIVERWRVPYSRRTELCVRENSGHFEHVL
jgi:hypothetical protein